MVDESQIALEQELLKCRIDESREALAQKIELLEEKVTQTVESATASVMDVTSSVVESVENATASVSETVGSVTDAVQGTVDTVRQSVEETVTSVKEAFDVRQQIGRYPWWAFAGSIVVGYACGRMMMSESSSKDDANRTSGVDDSSNDETEWVLQPASSQSQTKDNRGSNSNEAMSNRFSAANGCQASNDTSPYSATSRIGAKRMEAPKETHSGWHLAESLGPELSKLKGLAVGAVLSSLRDLVIKELPTPVQRPLADVIDGLTEKLGGMRL